jgi:hypothetical protein
VPCGRLRSTRVQRTTWLVQSCTTFSLLLNSSDKTNALSVTLKVQHSSVQTIQSIESVPNRSTISLVHTLLATYHFKTLLRSFALSAQYATLMLSSDCQSNLETITDAEYSSLRMYSLNVQLHLVAEHSCKSTQAISLWFSLNNSTTTSTATNGALTITICSTVPAIWLS